MSLEYLTGNSIRKYPFSDSSSLVSGSSWTLPNDAFLDFAFNSFDTSKSITVKLKSIVATTTLDFTFSARDIDDVEIEDDIQVSIPLVFTPFNTYGVSNSSYALRFVLGRGLLGLTNGFSQTFTNTAVILGSLCYPLVPVVSSILLYNQGDLFRTITADQESDVQLELSGGANITFADNGKVRMNVVPGAGTGLYDPCNGELYISSINEIKANNYGGFLLLSDDCYRQDQVENGLVLENLCTPKCTSDQFKAVAHYTNRLNDGLSDLGAFAAALAQELKDKIADYTTNIAPNKNNPYTKANFTKYPSVTAGQKLFSIVVGLFNPKYDDVSVTIGATGVTAVANSVRLKLGPTTAISSSLSPVTTTLPCLTVGRYEFVVKAVSGTATISGTIGGIAFSHTLNLS